MDDFDLPRDLPNFDQKIVRFAEKLSGLLDRRAVAIAREHLGSTGPARDRRSDKRQDSLQFPRSDIFSVSKAPHVRAASGNS